MVCFFVYGDFPWQNIKHPLKNKSQTITVIRKNGTVPTDWFLRTIPLTYLLVSAFAIYFDLIGAKNSMSSATIIPSPFDLNPPSSQGEITFGSIRILLLANRRVCSLEKGGFHWTHQRTHLTLLKQKKHTHKLQKMRSLPVIVYTCHIYYNHMKNMYINGWLDIQSIFVGNIFIYGWWFQPI